MTPDDLKARTKKFAVDVIRFAKAIPKDHINDEIASQLASTGSAGAVEEVDGCPPTMNRQSTIAIQQEIINQRSRINNVV